MEIYNKEKTKILTLDEIDLTLGELVHKVENIHHDEVPAVEEKGHYEILAEYPGGGKEIQWVVDIPGQVFQAEWDEPVEYMIYIPYSHEYLHNKRVREDIQARKQELSDSDYKIIKYVEDSSYYTEEEYAQIKERRKQLRLEINELESQLYESIPEDEENTMQ